MTNLDAAAIQARREYQRQWRAKNPDKVRANNRRYWEKKAQEYRESLKSSPLTQGSRA